MYLCIAPKCTQTTPDQTRRAKGRTRTERRALKGLTAKALLCTAHDRQRVKDAVQPLRRCGVRVVHAALLRVQVAFTDAPVLRFPGWRSLFVDFQSLWTFGYVPARQLNVFLFKNTSVSSIIERNIFFL